MAIFPPALEFLLDSEDRNRQYAKVSDSCPQGCAGPCFAISGVNSGAWPEQFAKIAAIPQAERGPAIAAFYESEFWIPLRIGVLSSQDVANRVLDAAVNSGGGTAIRLLQDAARFLGATITADGSLGPITALSVNAQDPAQMLDAYRQRRLHRYIEIAAEHPADAPYLKAWEARALG